MFQLTFIIKIFLFSFTLSKSLSEYKLFFNLFLQEEVTLDLITYSINKNNNIFYGDNLYYFGKIERLSELLVGKKNNKTIIEGNHPLVYVSELESLQYISKLPLNTVFIIEQYLQQYLNRMDNIKNYTIFIIDYFDYYYEFWISKSYFYFIIIGTDSTHLKNNLLYIIFFNILSCLLISIIIKKRLKAIPEEYTLPVHFLIYSITNLLIFINFISGLSYLFSDTILHFMTEYFICFLYSFYKSILFSKIILLFDGWLIITFISWGNRFKRLNKYIFLFDLIFSGIIIIVIYIIKIDKSKLFFLKNILEYLSLFIYIIFKIFKTYIPLVKQCHYEQRLRTNLIECVKYKERRYLCLLIIIISYYIAFILSVYFGFKYFYIYFDNFDINFKIQLGLDSVLIIFIFLLFFPKKLPDFYFEEVIFNYREKVYLLANIMDDDKNKNNLLIDNLDKNKLK